MCLNRWRPGSWHGGQLRSYAMESTLHDDAYRCVDDERLRGKVNKNDPCHDDLVKDLVKDLVDDTKGD